MTRTLAPRAISYRDDRAAEPVEVDAQDHAPAEVPAPTPGVQPAPQAPQLKILLLDDDDDFRDVISLSLASNRHVVTEAPNGVDGLRAVLKDTFDLIICDMMMPKLGGEMFYWAVTRVRPAARLRFIFVTGHKSDPKVQHFFERIHATVLYKPFTIGALHAAIGEVERKLR